MCHMLLSIISILISFTIFAGRPVAAFGKVEKALWFFSYFETKRIVFVVLAISIGLISVFINPENTVARILLVPTVIFCTLAFLMDFKYIFPEINHVEKDLPQDNTPSVDEKIIGVVAENTPVAYPHNVVIPRHIINDKIKNTHILISYCALCRSALIFDSSVENIHLSFTVAGVWRRNMVMVDNHTQSVWQQATGECIYGKYKGKKLNLLSGENTTWGTWHTNHPKSLFAHKFKEARRGYVSREVMLKGLYFATTRITPPGKTNLKGLPTRETVFGIDYNGIQRAYPISKIIDKKDFEGKFGDKILHLSYDKSGEFLYARENVSDLDIKVEKHWWLGWKEFHPETEIFG